jgi:hypothetical protein
MPLRLYRMRRGYKFLSRLLVNTNRLFRLGRTVPPADCARITGFRRPFLAISEPSGQIDPTLTVRQGGHGPTKLIDILTAEVEMRKHFST